MKEVALFMRTKKGSNEKLEHFVNAIFEDEVFDRLAADWTSYKENDTPKIGRYVYKSNEYGEEDGGERPLLIDLSILGAIR